MKKPIEELKSYCRFEVLFVEYVYNEFFKIPVTIIEGDKDVYGNSIFKIRYNGKGKITRWVGSKSLEGIRR